jgi:ubiquinone/menaquinone biosynthesis C-methylase UbiE
MVLRESVSSKEVRCSRTTTDVLEDLQPGVGRGTPLRLHTDHALSVYVREFYPQSGCVLDVGCGSGGYSWYFEQGEAGMYVGLDITARRFPELSSLRPARCVRRFVRGNAMGLPFEEGQFDFAIAIHSFEHIPDDEIVLREIARVLKKGGCVFVVAPSVWGLRCLYERSHGYRGYEPRRYSTLAAAVPSLEIVELVALGGLASFLYQAVTFNSQRVRYLVKRAKRALARWLSYEIEEDERVSKPLEHNSHAQERHTRHLVWCSKIDWVLRGVHVPLGQGALLRKSGDGCTC